MSTKVYILGAGSHGNGIRALMNSSLGVYKFAGFLDDDYKAKGAIGPLDIRLPDEEKYSYIVGVNDSTVRRKIYESTHRSIELIQHPTVFVGPSTYFMGYGIVLFPGVIITGNVTIDTNVHINVGCTISQGSRIGAHTTIAPGVNIAGQVQIGSGCQIGTGVAISNLVNIPDNTIIGAGSVVVDSIEESGTYVGAPARKVNV